jgi:hypothetical protein
MTSNGTNQYLGIPYNPNGQIVGSILTTVVLNMVISMTIACSARSMSPAPLTPRPSGSSLRWSKAIVRQKVRF